LNLEFVSDFGFRVSDLSPRFARSPFAWNLWCAAAAVAIVKIARWGAFLGLYAPAFLTDEVEMLDRRDALYAGAIAVICLIIPLIVVPTMANTVVSAWRDRAADAERMNLRTDRPIVNESSAPIADYFQQRGVAGAELSQQTSTVLATHVYMEGAVRGVQAGFAFLSIVTGAIGILVTLRLWASMRLH
jgi:hypothetical protein